MALERSTMKNFFAAMGSQMMGGYGAKTISTPMGPFQWDDNLQVWVNTNNGMQMNNIAFQDAMAMMDYNTAGGDESQFVCNYNLVTDTMSASEVIEPDSQVIFGVSNNFAENITCPVIVRFEFVGANVAGYTWSLSTDSGVSYQILLGNDTFQVNKNDIFGSSGNIRLRVQRSAIAPNGTIVTRLVNTSISPNVIMATFTVEGIS
jgi:hypothetical protein